MENSSITLEDLYKRVSGLLTERSTLFSGFTITDISTDAEIIYNEKQKFFFCTGTSKTTENKNITINLWIPMHVIGQYLKENIDTFQSKKNIKFDVLIDKLYLNNHGGSLVLIASRIKETGLSEREIMRRRLTKYCIEKGYFGREKKLLPKVIKSICAITAKNTEILSDVFQNINIKNENIAIFKCENDLEIARTLANIDQNNFDLILFFRGGREDNAMGIFSSEAIIDEVIKLKIPFCVALGHELDRPFIYELADFEQSTPSAFAKAITLHHNNTKKMLDTAFIALKNVFSLIFQKSIAKIENAASVIQGLSEKICEKKLGFVQISIQNIENLSDTIYRKRINFLDIIGKNISLYLNEIDNKMSAKVVNLFMNIEQNIELIIRSKMSSVETNLRAIETHCKAISMKKMQNIELVLQDINALHGKIEKDSAYKKQIKNEKKAKMRLYFFVAFLVCVVAILLFIISK